MGRRDVDALIFASVVGCNKIQISSRRNATLRHYLHRYRNVAQSERERGGTRELSFSLTHSDSSPLTIRLNDSHRIFPARCERAARLVNKQNRRHLKYRIATENEQGRFAKRGQQAVGERERGIDTDR